MRSIKTLLDEGRSIGEAAEMGRSQLLSQRSAVPPVAAPGAVSADGSLLAEFRQRLIESALALDSQRLTETLDSVFSTVSPECAIHDVLFLASEEIGELWVKGQCSVASEHLISDHIILRLRKLLEIAQVTRPRSKQAVCACFPDEQHEMALLALAYRLSCHGVPITYLGPCLPFDDLEQACQTLKPAHVVLSVTRQPIYETHRPGLIKLLKRQRGRFDFHIGGSGSPREDEAITALGARLWGPQARPQEMLEALGLSS